MKCPHCHKPISRSEIARAVATSGKTRGAPKRVMRPCPKCGVMFSAREMRIHLPQCPNR